MRFVLFTDKTVAQCMSALNERLHARPTSSRPQLDGWIEKGGHFALSVTCTVLWRFRRRTQLRARAEREDGVTVIRGYVSSGTSREGLAVIFAAILLLAALLTLNGNALLAVVVLLAAVGLYIPLTGDYRNSAVLMSELRRTLQTRAEPPKKERTRRQRR